MLDDGHLRYAVAQCEEGAEGSRHFQCYLEMTTPVRFAYLRDVFANEYRRAAHFERRLGTRDQAREYCMKDDTRVDGPWEWGVWGNGQGSRTDLVRACAIVAESGVRGLAYEDPGTLVRYSRGMLTYASLIRPERCDVSVGICFWGDTGIGKTRRAYDESLTEFEGSVFWKMPDNDWWDGYDGEDGVIIDDFMGIGMSEGALMRLLDRYPLRVNVKGGTVQFVAKRVWITSSMDPRDWYLWCNYAAFERRCVIHHLE